MMRPALCSCQSCGARIYWATTEAGRDMPVDASPYPDGNLATFLSPEGLIVRKYDGHAVQKDAPRRKSHFATCPQAAQHRKDR